MFQTNLARKPAGHVEIFLQAFLVGHVEKNFLYQHCVAVSWNFGAKVQLFDDALASHEREVYPTTWLHENRIVFEFQTDRNFYVKLRLRHLALKRKLFKSCGCETYKNKEVRNKHKKRSRRCWRIKAWRTENEVMEEAEAAVPLVTRVNNICTPFVPIFRSTSTIIETTNKLDSMHTSPAFPTTLRKPTLKTRELCTAMVTTMKNF